MASTVTATVFQDRKYDNDSDQHDVGVMKPTMWVSLSPGICGVALTLLVHVLSPRAMARVASTIVRDMRAGVHRRTDIQS